ncbi:MAG: Ig-like domain-containing protein, partial [Pseudomonadota bacterium]|nr:Ig-like domain-containing protein [Pseudomonadota bacterium]
VDQAVDLAGGGRIRVFADGGVYFVADGDFEELGAGQTRLVSFTYTIEDPHGETSTATATVTVQGRNDAPTPQDDAGEGFEVDEDAGGTTASVLANDTDPDTGDVLHVAGVDGVAMAEGDTVLLASGASVTLLAGGVFDWQANGAFDHLALGSVGSDSFEVQIADDHGGVSTSTVTLSVTGQNDAPTPQDDVKVGNETGTVSGNALANDTDPDGDPISVVEAGGTDIDTGFDVVGGGRARVLADGTYWFNPDGDFEDLGVGESRVVSFDYVVADSHGATSTATIEVEVQGRNDAPVAGDDAILSHEDATTEGSLFAANGAAGVADADIDGDPLTVTAVNGQAANIDVSLNLAGGGKLRVLSDGFFRFYAATGQFDHLAVGQTATVSFTYTVSDPFGGSDVGQAVITVEGRNDAPKGVADSFVTDEAALYSRNVLENNGGGADSDPDAGAVLHVGRVQGLGANVGQSIDLAAGGKVRVNADGKFWFDPDGDFEDLGAGEHRMVSFTYTVADQFNKMAAQPTTVSIRVNGIDDPAVAEDDAFTTSDADVLLASVFADNGSGEDSDPDGDAPMVASVEGQAANVGQPVALAGGGIVTLDADGNLVFDPAGDFDALDVGDTATVSFDYTLTGGSSATVTIEVEGTDQAPVARDDSFSPTERATAFVNYLFTGAGGGLDTDPEGHAFSVVAVNGQAAGVGAYVDLVGGGRLKVLSDGKFSFDAEADFLDLAVGETRTTSATYTIADGSGGSDTATVDFVVRGANSAPVARADTLVSFADSPRIGNLFADNGAGADSDFDGDALTVTRVNGQTSGVGSVIDLADGGFVIVQANGNFVFDPDGDFDLLRSGETDTASFTYSIRDQNGAAAASPATATVVVSGVDDAPVALNDAIAAAPTGVRSGNAMANNGFGADFDPDGDVIQIVAVEGDPGLVGNSFDLEEGGRVRLLSDGTFWFNPDGDFDDL